MTQDDLRLAREWLDADMKSAAGVEHDVASLAALLAQVRDEALTAAENALPHGHWCRDAVARLRRPR